MGVTGLTGAILLLGLTFGVLGAAGGTFGFHPDVAKMIGDLVSNLYEELVHRGLLFCALYGVATGRTFPMEGAADRLGVVVAALGSSILFAVGHGQYPLWLRAFLVVTALILAWPWVRARSLWACWIVHMLGDVVVDSTLSF